MFVRVNAIFNTCGVILHEGRIGGLETYAIFYFLKKAKVNTYLRDMSVTFPCASHPRNLNAILCLNCVVVQLIFSVVSNTKENN